MKIREVSPCLLCEYEPKEIKSSSEEIEYNVHSNCPMSITITPIVEYIENVKGTGCTCFKQKGQQPECEPYTYQWSR